MIIMEQSMHQLLPMIQEYSSLDVQQQLNQPDHQHRYTDTDLLVMLLDSAETPTLAHSLLTHFGSLHNLARASKWQLLRLPNVGEAQAARILALLALSQRLQEPAVDERTTLKNPKDAAKFLLPSMRWLSQEELRVVMLNIRQQIIGIHTIYRGSLHASVIRIGEIFRPAIEAPAASIILAHNHPSGACDPSNEDLQTTRQICKAGKLLNIKVLDHIIIGDGVYQSLREELSCFD